MKNLILGIALVTVSFGALADGQEKCAELVHSRTLAPISEITNATAATPYYTVARRKGSTTITYQCDGMGNYRQLMDFGWSIWRTGDEWNAVHWMQG